MTPYDSPTFLGRKNKFLLGLSAGQVGVVGVVIVVWLPVFFALGMLAILPRLLVVLPGAGVTLALIFVRIQGLSMPRYGVMSVRLLVRRPIYESEGEYLVNGPEGPAGGDLESGLASAEQVRLAQERREQRRSRGRMLKSEIGGWIDRSGRGIQNGIRELFRALLGTR